MIYLALSGFLFTQGIISEIFLLISTRPVSPFFSSAGHRPKLLPCPLPFPFSLGRAGSPSAGLVARQARQCLPPLSPGPTSHSFFSHTGPARLFSLPAHLPFLSSSPAWPAIFSLSSFDRQVGPTCRSFFFLRPGVHPTAPFARSLPATAALPAAHQHPLRSSTCSPSSLARAPPVTGPFTPGNGCPLPPSWTSMAGRSIHLPSAPYKSPNTFARSSSSIPPLAHHSLPPEHRRPKASPPPVPVRR
ncbi:hypothetical protein SEVIR_8G085532v4 [Setaria viridis]